jgi:hypothetical protein
MNSVACGVSRPFLGKDVGHAGAIIVSLDLEASYEETCRVLRIEAVTF